MTTTSPPKHQTACFCTSCGARYESDGSSPPAVEVRESPISLERKFRELVRAVFGRRMRKTNSLSAALLPFERRRFFRAFTAVVVRSPTGKNVFPSHSWPDIEIAARHPAFFDGCVSLATQYQAVTGRRAVVVYEF